MEIKKGEKGRVFNVTESDKRKNTVVANFSTYEGKDKDDHPVYSSWRTYFVGKAYEKAKSLAEKDEISLESASIQNNYNKEQERLYIQLTVFDFNKVK